MATGEKVDVEHRDGTETNAALMPVGVTVSHENGKIVNTTLIRYSGMSYNIVNGSATAVGRAQLLLGNNIPAGEAGNKAGRLTLYS